MAELCYWLDLAEIGWCDCCYEAHQVGRGGACVFFETCVDLAELGYWLDLTWLG